MKRVSVAVAKNTLPSLLHEAEKAPVEIVRHGKPVAVIVSSRDFERLRGQAPDAWKALEDFRAKHDLEALDLHAAFEDTRSRDPGRTVRW